MFNMCEFYSHNEISLYIYHIRQYLGSPHVELLNDTQLVPVLAYRHTRDLTTRFGPESNLR